MLQYVSGVSDQHSVFYYQFKPFYETNTFQNSRRRRLPRRWKTL